MDVLLVGFITGFGWAGWRTGFLHRAVGLLLVLLAFFLGAYLRAPMGALLTAIFPDIPSDYAELVGYTVAFPIILGIAYVVSARLLKDKAVTGMSRRSDQVLGVILGVIEAIIIISVVIVILDTYFGTKSSLGKTPGLGLLKQYQVSFNASETVKLLRSSTVPVVLAVVGPLLPQDISTLVPTGPTKGLPFPSNLPFP